MVPFLIPDYLAELEEAEARYAELSARYKAATTKSEEDSDEPFTEALSKQELKQLKDDVSEARQELAAILGAFIPRLEEAVARLDAEGAVDLVLNVFHSSLAILVECRVSTRRRSLQRTFGIWIDKYAVTLRELEMRRESAALRLNDFFKELGYV